MNVEFPRNKKRPTQRLRLPFRQVVKTTLDAPENKKGSPLRDLRLALALHALALYAPGVPENKKTHGETQRTVVFKLSSLPIIPL